jgi:hypothetical protein
LYAAVCGNGKSMSDQFTTVTTEGFGSRVGGSLVGMLFGLIVLPVAIGVLYWNEGRAVVAATALSQGAASVVEISANAVDGAHDGALVHVTGPMRAAHAARDPVFGVTGDGLLRLSRDAETYQWKETSRSETEQSMGGSKTTKTVYTYQRVWSGPAIASAQFKDPAGHGNPDVQIQPAMFAGGGVTLGVYQIDPPVLDKVSHFDPLPANTAPPADYKAVADGFYRGNDPAQPQIGDVRVHFSGVPAQTVSVVAGLANGTLTAFQGRDGYTIALAEPGVVPAAALFQAARHAEGNLTWIIRGVGFAAILLGFVLLASPITTVFSFVPFLGSLVGAGALLLAVTFAVPVTLVVIGVAWVAHRPLVGWVLIGGAVVVLVGLRRLHPRRAGRAA